MLMRQLPNEQRAMASSEKAETVSLPPTPEAVYEMEEPPRYSRTLPDGHVSRDNPKGCCLPMYYTQYVL